MSVYDRWHLARPPAGAKTCGKHKGKVPSAVHGQGLRWQVRGTDDRGRRVKFSFGSFEDAGTRDAELKAAVKAGRYVDERAGKVTLRSRCELWLTTRTHDPVTRERVEATFRNHVYEDPDHPGVTPRGRTAIGEVSMLLLSRQPTRLKAWLAALPLHDNTKCLLYDLIASVFRDAVHDHIIVESPFGDAVRRPRAVRRDVAAWPAALIADVAGSLPAQWEAMPLLAAACGHRQAEAFAVAKSDIDFLRRTCRIEAQLKLVGGRPVFAPIKNDRPRIVPLPSWTAGRLARHLELFPPVPVTLPWLKPDHTIGKDVTRLLLFTREGRRPLTRSAFNPHWRRAWKAAGVEDAEQVNGFHVCRHSAASAWLSGGLNIAKVAAFLGDSVAVVSRTYAHFLPDDDERARGIMEAHFSALAERHPAPVVPRMASE
jgi:integrase